MSYTYENLRIDGISNVIRVLKFNMNVSHGKHGEAYLKIMMGNHLSVPEMSSSLELQRVRVYIEIEKEKITIFTGIIKDCNYNCSCEFCEAGIHLISGTYLLDLERKSRSFQNVQETFEQIVKKVLKDTTNSDAIFSCGSNSTSIPFIQYQETDWEFIRRLASHCRTSLIPEVGSGEPKFWFGLEKTGKEAIFTGADYKVVISGKFYKMGGKQNGLDKRDFLYYEVTSDENYQIGDMAEIKGQNLWICSKAVKMEKAILKFSYRLSKESYVFEKEFFNKTIAGATLKGTVIETKKESIKLHLDIDQEQDIYNAFFYPWVPDSGNLFYCMPKVGTKAALYFGSEDERLAKAIHCYHLNGKICREMEESQDKYIETEHNKQIHISPNTLELQSKNAFLDFKLIDDFGVQFQSNKLVSITAKDNISINGSKVTIYAPLQVTAIKSNINSNTVFNICNQFDAIGKVGGLSGNDKRKYETKPRKQNKKSAKSDTSSCVLAGLAAIPSEAGTETAVSKAIGALPI